MGLRTNMPDDEQLFTAYHYARNDITKQIDLKEDTPTPFEYTDYQSEGNKQEDKIILNNRRDTSDSRFIETDYDLIATDSIIVIDELEYSVSSVTPKSNNSYDLRRLRGFNNRTYIIALDL